MSKLFAERIVLHPLTPRPPSFISLTSTRSAPNPPLPYQCLSSTTMTSPARTSAILSAMKISQTSGITTTLSSIRTARSLVQAGPSTCTRTPHLGDTPANLGTRRAPSQTRGRTISWTHTHRTRRPLTMASTVVSPVVIDHKCLGQLTTVLDRNVYDRVTHEQARDMPGQTAGGLVAAPRCSFMPPAVYPLTISRDQGTLPPVPSQPANCKHSQHLRSILDHLAIGLVGQLSTSYAAGTPQHGVCEQPLADPSMASQRSFHRPAISMDEGKGHVADHPHLHPAATGNDGE